LPHLSVNHFFFFWCVHYCLLWGFKVRADHGGFEWHHGVSVKKDCHVHYFRCSLAWIAAADGCGEVSHVFRVVSALQARRRRIRRARQRRGSLFLDSGFHGRRVST
jgi:hypothetical protein